MVHSIFSAPFLERGFRPFFLMAALYTTAAPLVWILQMKGTLQPTLLSENPVLWHGHEMLFGFTVAVIAGFLLTAVANWTGGETARGGHLAALCVLWAAGRAIPFTGASYAVAAVIDLAFLPVLAASLAVPLVRSRNTQNFIFLFMIGLLFLCNAAFWVLPGRQSLYAAVIFVMTVISAIGGRIIPSFTVAGLRRAGMNVSQTDQRGLDVIALLSVFLLAVFIFLFGADSMLTGSVSLVAALLHGFRHLRYHPTKVWRQPLLWILHAGHLWMITGFLLIAVSGFSIIPASPALHALTAGAIGTLTLGMMCRVTLGHTGRRMQAGPATTVSFLLMQAAIFLRICGPLLYPQAHMIWIEASAFLWAAAFAAYLVHYAPFLMRRGCNEAEKNDAKK